MALGAQPIQVVRLVLGKTTLLLVLGSVVGLTLALAAGQVIASVVYGAQPRDPLVLLSVWGSIALIAFSAAWSPARRATRVDPLVALRYE
jgi:ABC-type antimicrobial peptide transport system permease subunit